MPGLQAQVTKRVVRGIALWRARRHEMEALGSGEWFVPSSTQEGAGHRVSLVEETCSCGDAAYHPEHRCKHRWAIELELVLRAVLAESYPGYWETDDHDPPDGHRGFGRRPR